jgi:excisionase family DNA binding protein
MARQQKSKRRFFTTSEVARYCGVSTDGVLRWIRARKLRAFSTPGGHHRVSEEDFKVFLAQYGIPIDDSYFNGQVSRPRTVLVIENDPGQRHEFARLLREVDRDMQVHEAVDGWQAGLRIGELRPDLVVLDLALPHLDGIELLRTLRDNPGTRGVRVIAINGGEGRLLRRAYEAGADVCLTKPLRSGPFRNEVSRLLGLSVEARPDGGTG